MPVVNQNLMNNVNQVKSLMAMVQNSQNPQAMLSNLMAQNPQVQNTMQTISQYGGNAQRAFYETCRQRGIDPNQIISMLK